MKRVFGFCIFRVNTCFYSRSTVDPTRSLSVEPLLHYRFLVARSVVEIIETLVGTGCLYSSAKKSDFSDGEGRSYNWFRSFVLAYLFLVLCWLQCSR